MANATAVMILAFGLLFVTNPRSRLLQTTSQANTSATGAILVVVASEVKEKIIRFGDELVVQLILQNQGTKPIQIPADALLLSNEQWSQGSGSGSGLGEFPLLRTGVNGKEAFTLQSGESVALTGSSAELGAFSLGPMKAEFVIATENEDLREELGRQKRFTVSYYVAPSRLMTSAWVAETADDRKRLQPQIRELLLLASKPDESPGFYVPKTLEYLG